MPGHHRHRNSRPSWITTPQNLCKRSLPSHKVTVIKPHKNALKVPKNVLAIMRLKQKARRKLTSNYSPENLHSFNYHNNRDRVTLRRFKQSRSEKKFSELKNFIQSSSKHWRILNNLHSDKADRKPHYTLLHNGSPVTASLSIAVKFGTILSTNFGTHSALKALQFTQIKITSQHSPSQQPICTTH